MTKRIGEFNTLKIKEPKEQQVLEDKKLKDSMKVSVALPSVHYDHKEFIGKHTRNPADPPLIGERKN